MIDLNKIAQNIEQEKPQITKAISLAFANGNKEKTQELYEAFYPKINNSKVFVFKINDRETKYVKSLKKILDNIEQYIGYDVSERYIESINEAFVTEALEANRIDLGLPSDIEKILYKKYFSFELAFKRLTINYEKFIELYKKNGLDYVNELYKQVEVLNNKSLFFTTKNDFAKFKETFSYLYNLYTTEEIIETYNIESINDLMDFYTEISSLLLNEETLNEDERKVVEENRKKLVYRSGGEGLANSPFALRILQKRIENIYKDNTLKISFNESNLKDFFNKFKFDFTKTNLNTAMQMYNYTHNVEGFRTVVEFDGKWHNFCFFNDIAFKRNNKSQKTVVIHELIHTLEDTPCERTNRTFNTKYREINEALTQFLAERATEYVDFVLVENNEDNNIEVVSDYNCMKPLVEELEKSLLWDDILACKISNDYTLLEDKLGKYASDIYKLFKDTYKEYRNNYNEIGEEMAKSLIKLISKVEKEKYNQQKKK